MTSYIDVTETINAIYKMSYHIEQLKILANDNPILNIFIILCLTLIYTTYYIILKSSFKVVWYLFKKYKNTK